METLIFIFVFSVVLFLYLHIYFHLKVSDDLEVFEVEQPSKDNLEEICDLRQPVIFKMENIDYLLRSCNVLEVRKNYGAFDVKICDIYEKDDTVEKYLPLTLNTATEVFRKDGKEKFLSSNNYDFLEETSLVKEYQQHDQILRPLSVCSCYYDYMFGAKNVHTVLSYEVNYRNYFLVTSGSIQIKLLPPKFTKYLNHRVDYDNFEFLSPVNPWCVQDEYKSEVEKTKMLDVTLVEGQVIHIPAYWWYSIKYNSSDTSVCSFKYKTYMNHVAILNHSCMRMLQSQNVKRDTVTKVERVESKEKESVATDTTDHIEKID
jgi:hypothetical protein